MDLKPKTPPPAIRVSFTGKLASLTHSQAWVLARKAGMIPVSSISGKTDLLVVGMQGWPLLPDGSVSIKLKHAEALIERGAPLQIIPEVEFLERAGVQQPRAEVHKTYPAEDICRLVGVTPETLRQWELLSLVRASGGRYDFQDIVSLQTIADLVERGVKPGMISKTLSDLKAILPGTDRPLAQLRIVLENPHSLLAEIGELRLTSSGQLTLNFEDTADESDNAPTHVSMRRSRPPTDWFERGRELEDLERYEDAERAYLKAIDAQPACAEAYYNLGNVLRALGKQAAAYEMFREAIRHDSTLAAAYYNLADLQEEQGRIEEAIKSLDAAVKIAPDYADAHFNLAFCYQQAGRQAEAAVHWSKYLRLDPASEWADVAKRFLRAVEV